ncbi:MULTISPECIES: hypothetical protein [Sphingomonas]|uniref:hypothetical protein n=1 Tax=Sphingomonas TaxID=13687 RepID=UPI000701BB53|nr:hypothetical protein [Sphingomonas sp. Leaf208]KQM53760.1 hypothetical protein ASE69_19545 [Sphingomonas sp. Leaf208]
MLHGINLEVAAEWNRRMLLQILRTSGQKTRRELAAVTGLSMPAIANIAGLLIKDGFVRESGRTSGGRGQPAIRLQMVQDRAICVGVDVGSSAMRLVAVNLAGQVVHRQTQARDVADETEVCAAITVAVADLLASGILDASKVIGVSVARCGSRIDRADQGEASTTNAIGRLGGRADQHASESEFTFVSSYEALAAMEPFHRTGHEIGRFGYVHLSASPLLVTVTGRSTGHLHVEAKRIPQGAKIAARLQAASEAQPIVATTAASNGAVADCAGDLHLALHEAYGRSVPTTLFVGGYVTDSVAIDLATALGKLRGSGSVVSPATEPDYAVAIGAAAMLIEDRLMPQGVLCPKINDDIGGELETLARSNFRLATCEPVDRGVAN